MIGGLIEKQHVWVKYQQFSQGYPHQPPAAELVQRTDEIARPETEARKNDFSFMFDIIAAGVFIFML